MPCLVAGSKPASQLFLNLNYQTYETPVVFFHVELNQTIDGMVVFIPAN
jgi:hypothetical protein